MTGPQSLFSANDRLLYDRTTAPLSFPHPPLQGEDPLLRDPGREDLYGGRGVIPVPTATVTVEVTRKGQLNLHKFEASVTQAPYAGLNK